MSRSPGCSRPPRPPSWRCGLVCGKTIEQAGAVLDTDDGPIYFCSAGCRAEYLTGQLDRAPVAAAGAGKER